MQFIIDMFAWYGLVNGLFWAWITWRGIRNRHQRTITRTNENGRKNAH